MMQAFLTKEMTSDQRWDLIEDYFLGHDDAVNAVLGLDDRD